MLGDKAQFLEGLRKVLNGETRPPPEQLLSLKEASKVLASLDVKIGAKSLYKYASGEYAPRLVATNISGSYAVRLSDLMEWIPQYQAKKKSEKRGRPAGSRTK